jgi:cytochrome c-type biogenesis protein CcmH/NrfG
VDLDEATAAYNVAIELDPHAPEVYLHRGLAAVHIARGDFTLALTDLHNAIRLDPTDPTSISHTATDERAVYANRGHQEAAIARGRPTDATNAILVREPR